LQNAKVKLEDLEHWKKRARRAERAQSRNESHAQTMSVDAKSGIEPVDGMPRRRKRTVSIRRFRVNSDGTKTLVCIIKPERGGSA
jgi:hypothetical protein